MPQIPIETVATHPGTSTARDRMARAAAHSGHTDPSCLGCRVLAANGSRTMQAPPPGRGAVHRSTPGGK